MREWGGEDTDQGDEWVIDRSGPLGYYVLLLGSPSCGGLVNDADRVIPVAFHLTHLRRVISI